MRGLLNARNESDLMDKMEDCVTGISQITQTATLRLNVSPQRRRKGGKERERDFDSCVTCRNPRARAVSKC